MNIWIVLAGLLALAAVSAPVIAIFLVSFASLSEESAHSLSGSAPGLTERLARRLLDYHAVQPGKASLRPGPGRGPRHEVRFDHARRPVPDSGRHPARSESQPGADRADQRQGAGV